MDHARNAVQRFTVDGHARVIGIDELGQQFLHAVCLIHRNNVDARHHDVVNPKP